MTFRATTPCLRRAYLALQIFLTPAFVLSQSQSDSTTHLAPFQGQATFLAKANQLEYLLSDSLLIPDTEVVWADSVRLTRQSDYTLDHVNGVLRLQASLREGSSVRISYRKWPFSLRKSYMKRAIVLEQLPGDSAQANGNHRVAQTPRPAPAFGQEFGSNLKKSGSLIRGITIGTDQDLQVDSGLRMQISGRLAENVDVVASLTDRNTPLQPEGNTQALQEIDKVFVQIKAPNLQATLGDYNLSFDGTEFTSYSRKLQGAMGIANYHDTKLTVSGAVSRGRFATNEFLGREGNQGPYQLTGTEGQINIIVLAGTERVWIDGQPMVRGENHDYVIEYGNGQITFTRNRLITSDSRITVDFQFSDESFQRNLWGIRGESKFLDERVKLETTFIRETDDKDNLLSGRELEDSFVRALEMSGDSAAVVPGWTFVGADSGNYVRDDFGVFTFVGNQQGDYNVSFSFFGANNGDYRNLGLGRFEYVGPNLGSYRPVIILPQARRHDILGFNVNLTPHSSVTINSEVALSQLDRNLFSSIGDNDNSGTAYSLNLNFRPESVGIGGHNLGKLDLQAKLRRKNATFQEIDRTTQIEFNRKWNIANAQSPEETITEVQGTYAPTSGLELGGGFGHLSKSSIFGSDRWEARANLNRKSLPKLNYFVENIDRIDSNFGQSSNWLRHRGRGDYELKMFKPIFEFEGEIKKDSQGDTTQTGFRYESITGGLAVNPWKSVTASYKYNYRDDKERVGGTFLPKSVARTQFYTWALQNWHAMSITASYTHRTRDFTDLAVQDTRTDLADLRLGYAPQQGGVRTNVYYQISNTQIARQEEVFVEVEEGEGNFRFNEELNEFEPDPFGDFIRQVIATNDFVPVVELRFRTDLRLTPKKIFGITTASGQKLGLLRRILSPLTSESFLRIDERTRERDVEKIYLLNLSHFRQDSTTIFGSIELRQDLHLWENSRQFSMRYRFRTRQEKNNQFVGGGQDRDTREHRLRVLKRFSNQVSTQVEYVNSLESRIFETAGREDRKIRSHNLETDLVYRPQPRLEVALKSDIGLSRDIVQTPATKATIFSFAPRTSYSLSQKGRFRGEINWTKVVVSPKDRLIPFELTEGNRAGTTFRWNFGLDYRMSQNIQASFSYFGRNEPDRPRVQHFAKVEMRAFF